MKIRNLKECEEALNKLQKADAELLTRTAKVNLEIENVRTAALDQITECETEITEIRNAIEGFAKSNRKKIFLPTRKSVIMQAGEIGFSDNPVSIVLCDGFTDALVLKKAKAAKLSQIVRTGKETIDKTAAKKLADKVLAKIGLQRMQTETFYIKLNTLETI